MFFRSLADEEEFVRLMTTYSISTTDVLTFLHGYVRFCLVGLAFFSPLLILFAINVELSTSVIPDSSFYSIPEILSLLSTFAFVEPADFSVFIEITGAAILNPSKISQIWLIFVLILVDFRAY